MKWLVVVEGRATPDSFIGLLEDAHATIASGADWIQLDGDERTIEVEGPEDLPTRLDSARGVVEIYPSSEQTAY